LRPLKSLSLPSSVESGFHNMFHPSADPFAPTRWLICWPRLGVNPDTIYKWIERKKMPAHKVGRLWKFKVSEVDAWICGGKAGQERKESRR